MNAILERWVQTCCRELRGRTLIWNQQHLMHALREFERRYNEHRAHQGIANARPLRPMPLPCTDRVEISLLDVLRCDRLGGILREYELHGWGIGSRIPQPRHRVMAAPVVSSMPDHDGAQVSRGQQYRRARLSPRYRQSDLLKAAGPVGRKPPGEPHVPGCLSSCHTLSSLRLIGSRER
jgi:hypothetical protein